MRFAGMAIGAMLLFGAGAARADVPQAKIHSPGPEREDPETRAKKEGEGAEAVTEAEHRTARREVIAGSVLIPAGILSIVIGGFAFKNMGTRNVEGGYGGPFDGLGLIVGIAGVWCELLGIPLLIDGALTLAKAPKKPAWVAAIPTASAGPRGGTLTWQF